MSNTTHDLPAAYGAVPCEWQGCEEDAVCLRDTPWGCVPMCPAHEHAHLEPDSCCVTTGDGGCVAPGRCMHSAPSTSKVSAP